MINRVSIFDNKINNIRRNQIHFRGDEQQDEKKVVSNIFEQSENKGLDALAAYNYAMSAIPVAKDKLDIEPLTPIIIAPEDIDKMTGEKIYSSDGKLHSIVQRNENTYTVNTLDKDNENMFSDIETFDKKTGNILLRQRNIIEDGKYTNYYLTKYDANTQKPIATTDYEGSELYSASKTIYKPNGNQEDINKYYKEKEFYIAESSKDGKNHANITLNDNKQITNLSIRHNKKLSSKELNASFYNGALTSISTTNTMTIPNTLGWENFKSDSELKPAALFKKIENLNNIEGEKTYYSNGATETNTFESDNGKTTAYFKPDGTCYKIESENKTVEFDGKNQTITELLDNNKTKITRLYESGDKSVKLKDNDTYKRIDYTSKNYPDYYIEGIIINGEEKDTKYLYYDDNGMLEQGYDYIA